MDPLLEQLGALVDYYLSIHLFDNATDLCELLVTLKPSEAHRHLLASCYICTGNIKTAVEVLRDCRTPSNRFLFARYCYQLGRLEEAETALLTAHRYSTQSPERIVDQVRNDPSSIPNGAAGVYLLGQIAQRGGRIDHAILYFQLAVELDPFLFSAFKSLVKLQGHGDSEAVFGSTALRAAATSFYSGRGGDLEPLLGQQNEPLEAQVAETPRRRLGGLLAGVTNSAESSDQHMEGSAEGSSSKPPHRPLWGIAEGHTTEDRSRGKAGPGVAAVNSPVSVVYGDTAASGEPPRAPSSASRPAQKGERQAPGTKTKAPKPPMASPTGTPSHLNSSIMSTFSVHTSVSQHSDYSIRSRHSAVSTGSAASLNLPHSPRRAFHSPPLHPGFAATGIGEEDNLDDEQAMDKSSDEAEPQLAEDFHEGPLQASAAQAVLNMLQQMGKVVECTGS